MAMTANEIEELILKTFPNAKVIIDDLRGDGDHYAAQIIAEEFKGKTRVQQHKMVYNAMGGKMGKELHALALNTSVPKDLRRLQMDQNTKDKIQDIIDNNEVLLFMKGTPVMPQCGFSAAVVGVLSHMGIKYNSVNVLEDSEIREGIKEFSDWPTIPQLYVKKEFVGGCDIIREMHENGELSEYFNQSGISSN